MAVGRMGEKQGEMFYTWDELPRSPGHPFYDRLQKELEKAGFDAFAESLCAPYYASGKRGRPSLVPGRYFRMHLVGYFEGIDSERGIEWKCSDSLALRDFLKLKVSDHVPDHSTLSTTRKRLPLEIHQEIFSWVLKVLRESKLVYGERIGVDASTMEANAAMRSIVRRGTGESYREMLVQMAKESGIETPTTEQLIRLDRKRKGKKLSNEDWESKTDSDARIARMKNGSTHMAYKPEHAVDLDTGAVVAVEVHLADSGDTKTLGKTLDTAKANLEKVTPTPPTAEDPAELIADKGYHSREVLKGLEDGPWKTRIAEPERRGVNRWKGDDAARRAVYNNRNRIQSGIGKATMRKRGEVVERSFEHVLDRGGMRRTWLRGQENVSKRYLIHVAGFNLGILMRHLTGKGTPRGWAERRLCIFVLEIPLGTLSGVGLTSGAELISLLLIFAGRMDDWSNCDS